MPREAEPGRLAVADLPQQWDKPVGDKWFGDRECTPGDHFYETLASLYAGRRAEPYDGEHIHQSCHTFEDVESYPPRALATEIDVDAGACVLAGLSQLPRADRRDIIETLEGVPDTASSYELTARAFLRAMEDDPDDVTAAAKSVAKRARADGLLLSHEESYDHYGHGDIGLGSTVTAADGDVTVAVDRLYGASPTHLPHTWLFYGGEVTDTAIDEIDEGETVAVGARTVTACTPPNPPATDAAMAELASLPVSSPRAVALLRLLDAESEARDTALLAEQLDPFVAALDHDLPLVRRFGRGILQEIADSGHTEVFLDDIDQWFDLLFERDRNRAYRSIVNKTATANPEAFVEYIPELLDFAEGTDDRSVVTDSLAAVAEHDVDALVPHVDRLCEYVRDGEWETSMASAVLAPVASYDASLVSPLFEELVTTLPDGRNAECLQALIRAAPSLVEGHIDTTAAPGDDPERGHDTREQIKLVNELAKHHPELVGDHVAELIPLCDEDEYTESTANAAREAVLRVAVDHPDAVAPHASALADRYRENTEDPYHDGALYAGIFTYLLQHDVEAAKRIELETFAQSLCDHAADTPVFPEGLQRDLDGDRLTELATGDDETAALMAHAVFLHLDLVDRGDGVDSPFLEGGDVGAEERDEDDDGMLVLGHNPDFDLEDRLVVSHESTGRRQHAALVGLGEYCRSSGKDVILDNYEKLVELAATTEGDARGRVFKFMRRHPRSCAGDPADVPDAAVDQAIDALDDEARRSRLRAMHMLLHTIPARGQDRLEANLDSVLDIYDDDRITDSTVSQLLAALTIERPEILSSLDTERLLDPIDEDTYLPNGEYDDVVDIVEENAR